MTIKQAVLRDLDSRNAEFIEIIKDICQRLAALGGGLNGNTAILMQSGETLGIVSSNNFNNFDDWKSPLLKCSVPGPIAGIVSPFAAPH